MNPRTIIPTSLLSALLAAPAARSQHDLAALRRDLASQDWTVRERAVAGLARLGAPAVDDLARALRDRSEAVRRAAAWALGPIGEPAHGAAGALVDGLNDPVREVREACAVALGWMRVRRAGVVAGLVRATRDRWSWARKAAAISLGEVRVEPERSVPALVKLLRDHNPFVRDAATRALSWILRDAPDHLGTLLGVRGATDWRVRRAVCEVVDRIGPAARAAKSALRELAGDTYYKVREAAALALVSLRR